MATKTKAPGATEAQENTQHQNHSMLAPSDIGSFAKSIGHGPKKFFKLLKRDGFLQVDAIAFQCWIDRGYFIVVERLPAIAENGASFARFQTLITAAGRDFLRNRYSNGGC
jgi:phage antirepressor YoqD-like protein